MALLGTATLLNGDMVVCVGALKPLIDTVTPPMLPSFFRSVASKHSSQATGGCRGC
jgi:hypothetical protein